MPAELESWRTKRQKLSFAAVLAEKGWYHSYRLPDGREIDGAIPLAELQRRVSKMPIAENLKGKRVLDVGAWDGWFSFEMERRGATVVAIDCVEIPNFLQIHQTLRSKVEYRISDFYDLSPAETGRFDIVLFLGVLYHLKHPLLALERICAFANDLAIVTSFITDEYTRPVAELLAEVPRLEFFETDELGGNLDNWFGPNLASLMALCRAAGFARVELLDISGPTATLACHRKWLPVPKNPTPAPVLKDAVHSIDYGINFRGTSEAYVSAWFESSADLKRDDIEPEVGGFGVRCLSLQKHGPNVWQCNFRLPPGLDPGWYPVDLRTAGSAASNQKNIAVDVPVESPGVVIHGCCDALTSEPGVIHMGPDGARVSIWILGLPRNADRNNLKVSLGAKRMTVDTITPSVENTVQVNAAIPQASVNGAQTLKVAIGGYSSPGVEVRVLS